MSNHQSHDDSSDADYDEDGAHTVETQFDTKEKDSTNSSRENPAPSHHAPAPMQKRRRVTRACDECRRKKIKCDGKQPCTHCTVYSYDCTYDQPSNRRRNPAPQYVEALENRLRRAEVILKSVMPEVNLDDPEDIDCSTKNHSRQLQTDQARPWEPLENGGTIQQSSGGEDDSMLESMVANTGSLDLDEEGHWDFYGHSSGRIFLRKMRDEFGDLMGKPDNVPFMKHHKIMAGSLFVDSPKGASDTSMDLDLPKTHDLPEKHCAKLLCENALDDAGAIVRIVHQPTFYAMFDRVYDTPYEKFSAEEHRFLPLLYGVIALGSLFARSDQSQLQMKGYENAIDQGYRWHKCSRQMIDVVDCRDLQSIQIILYMILFLQSSARLSTCYTYLGIVLRSAIRLGLHRSVSNAFNPVEQELRKRIFWIIRKLDIYVGALLGLPQMLNNDDIDQEMPMEIDDDYITIEGIIPMPSDRISLFTAINAHNRLVEILAKTVKYIYPIKGHRDWHGRDNQSYVVSHTKIREIEQDLQAWMEKLPMIFRPGEETSPEFTRIRHLLRMAYAHIQMFLYRPFLHYVSPSGQEKNFDRRSYACAAACISVSRNIVHLTGQMRRRGLLVGSYWFYMYTTFFAIISLVFYALENPQSPRVEDILGDALEGKETLAALAAKSLAADRCSTILAELFDQLPRRLRDIRHSAPQKKRSAPSQYPEIAPQMFPKASGISNESPSTDGAGEIVPKINPPPTQNGSQDTPSLQDSTILNHYPVSSAEGPYPNEPEDRYTPSNPSFPGFETSNSPHSSMPSTGDQSTYDVQNPFVDQGVSDVSAMMFPSADPFAYPNQPMTTLETTNFIKQENSLDPNIYNISDSTTSDAPYNGYGSQMYGQMPPYPMQGQQQPGYVQEMNQPPGIIGTASNAMPAITQAYEPGHWPLNREERSSNTSGVGFDQLFGEDWGGWISQYRQ